MLASHTKSPSNINTSSGSGSGSGNNDTNTNNPTSVSARLSAGMMPYFIPPQPPHLTQRPSCENGNLDPSLDPTLMTPPMSPTEQSFGTTIEGRFASSSSSSSFSHQSPFPLTEQRLPWTDMAHYSALDTFSSPSSGPLSTTGSTTAVSPRPLSFHWDSYDAVEEDEDEQDDRDSDEEAETDYHHENSRMSNNSTYHRQFEGHHSMVRRRSSMGGGGGGGSFEKTYDSLRHGIGLNVSDMSEELAKARSKMSRTSRAMKSMEQELEAMQLSIDESKASSASTRTAIEENFWRLECLALTIESDRQETNKRLQTVGRECSEVRGAVALDCMDATPNYYFCFAQCRLDVISPNR
ncbi:hypothetical protein EDD21DRAFT_91076, partial [Dissophora ornata]